MAIRIYGHPQQYVHSAMAATASCPREERRNLPLCVCLDELQGWLGQGGAAGIFHGDHRHLRPGPSDGPAVGQRAAPPRVQPANHSLQETG
jgi:hypothetical protein